MRLAAALFLAGSSTAVLAEESPADRVPAEGCSFYLPDEGVWQLGPCPGFVVAWSGDPANFLIARGDALTFAASDSDNVGYTAHKQADGSWCIQDHPEVTVRCRANDGTPVTRP